MEAETAVAHEPPVRPGDWLLHFEVPGLLLCLPLTSVIRVLPIVALAPLPFAPAFVSGLLNLHGRPIPVVDLAVRLGQSRPARYPIETPMLHCRQGSRDGVLLVTRVLAPRALDADGVGVGASGIGESVGALFRGSVAFDARMSMLLNPGAAFSPVDDHARPTPGHSDVAGPVVSAA